MVQLFFLLFIFTYFFKMSLIDNIKLDLVSFLN